MIDLKEMTVLIVDDIITMCKSIHRMMNTIGYGNQFFYAHNGREALRILRKEPIDLVLIDYNMPEMQGGEALSIIRVDRLL
ncbi:MAG: response regulator, partial [Desulfobacteraceae bacterium]|nr:response regulator [Desulfobacteraceae bacterium]